MCGNYGSYYLCYTLARILKSESNQITYLVYSCDDGILTITSVLSS